MKVARKDLALDFRNMDRLSQGLFKLLESLCPQRLGIYSPIFGEPDLTAELTTWATSRGCKIYWPAITSEGMVYRRWTLGASMQKDAFGIDSPMDDASEETPDVIIVPCLGHDEEGHRLGYGKGCFDRYLSGHPDVVTVGLSFEKLLVPRAIFEEYDHPMDYLVTEKGIQKS